MAVIVSFVALVVCLTVLYSIKVLPSLVRQWMFLFKGRQWLLELSQKNPHAAFSIPVPGYTLHLGTTPQHWLDINNADPKVLSMNAASREFIQPLYAYGFDWSDRRQLTAPPTLKSMRIVISQGDETHGKWVKILDQEFLKAVAWQPKRGEWTRVPLLHTVKRVNTRISTLMLLGEDACNDEKFTVHSMGFVAQLGYVVEAVRLVPEFLAPLASFIIKGRNRDQEYIFKTIQRLIEDRARLNNSMSDDKLPKPITFLEGFVDYSSTELQQNSVLATYAIMTTWVTSMQTIPLVSCHLLQDIYTHTSYLSALKAEAKAASIPQSQFPHSPVDLDKLPLLEKFIMESIRTQCFISNTAHRMTTAPFTFSDGYTVPAGEKVEFDMRGVMLDSETYPEPFKFDPQRWDNTGRSVLDIGYEWPFWGTQRGACPGRYHVSNVMKLVAVHLLTNYDCEFEDTRKLNITWREVSVPNPKNILLMRAAQAV